MAKEVQAAAAVAGTSTLKTMLIVTGILALEGATILGTVYLSGPQAAQGQQADQAVNEARQNKLVEIQLIKKKFFNQRSGRGYYYDTEIYITTRAKNESQVTDQIKSTQAALTEQIGTLFRQADHSMFLEPTRAMLKRKLKALLDKHFGHDADGQPIIAQVLIKNCIPYPADF